MLEYVFILPLLSFAVAGIILAFGKWLPGKGASAGIAVAAWGFVQALFMFVKAMRGGLTLPYEASIPWFSFGPHQATLGVYVDGLTIAMLIVVTAVSLLVQIYSLGYMRGDPRFKRYYSYLSLFTASMLGLTVSDNMLVFFMCWELVGVCSYLLIGFWFEKPSAAYAGKKAFITTKLGDLGFLVGLLSLFYCTGTFRISQILELAHIGFIPPAAAGAAAILLFLGAVGKSAQFPLLIWLPDAMEGPSPVSALIHAATMVAAGVYMVARLYAVYILSPAAMDTVAWTGAITAFTAASMALVCFDLKRVLAFSTVSQLGYMMLALGAGGFTAGLFHLTTHAYFKALLFLAAGSVIHAVHSNDMREMGALKNKMPITYITFLLGTLALVGIPPFAGFFSKDEILAAALARSPYLYAFGAVTAALTAFYMARALVMTFHGTPKDPGKYNHAHESPPVMTGPLILLAAASVVSGWALSRHEIFARLVNFEGVLPFELRHISHGAVALYAGITAVLSMGLGAWLYKARPGIPAMLRGKFAAIAALLDRRYGLDAFFLKIVAVSDSLSAVLFSFDFNFLDAIAIDGWAWLTEKFSRLQRWFDDNIVDAAVDATGTVTLFAGRLTRRAQTGLVQNYLFFVAAAVSIFAAMAFATG
ncbi:MAG: NADH-quinone oxidoreductase subunit L [Elusimicrobia bacterium]|nr:NADH-quinone oxidoreductase subunit L [Elusimicrobiota bacterium]